MKSIYFELAAVLSVCLIIPAAAQEWSWYLNRDILNPSGVYSTDYCSPFLYDMEGDGDLDLILGCGDGTVELYINDGFPETEHWILDEDYFDGLTFDYAVIPTMGDFDGDDSLELVLGFRDWIDPADSLRVYRNRGTQQEPQWHELTGFFNFSTTGYTDQEFVDWDSDGDFDLMLGDVQQGYRFYRNTGEDGEPFWELDSLITSLLPSPWDLMAFEGFDIADFNSDGYNDIIFAYESYESISFILAKFNEGTNEIPDYTSSGFWFTDTSDNRNTISVGDIDTDGDLDFINGNETPLLFYYANEGNSESPEFSTNSRIKIGPFFIKNGLDLAFFDRDNDNDLDFAVFIHFLLLPGGGHIIYPTSYVNLGTPTDPDFMYISWFPWWYAEYTDMAWTHGDLDGDGWRDLVCSFHGYLRTFWNIPNSDFEQDDTVFDDIEIDVRHPELADLDSDGDLDLFVIDTMANELTAFENVGTPQEPEWSQRHEWTDGLDLSAAFVRTARLDEDELPDLVLLVDNHLRGYLNIGNLDDPDFQYFPEIFEGWQDYDVYYFDVADLDGDNDDDIVLDDNGIILFLENQSTLDVDDYVTKPDDYSQLSNYPNPFNSSTTISFSLPEGGQVKLGIYDLTGRMVKILLADRIDAGAHSVTWGGKNNAGQAVSSGVYFYKLNSEGYSDTRRMLLLK
ncbi:MAG: FG-GAP-like repeat-containing protein [Planctomycetota bacterium]|jgi:hypothetical protein